MVDAQDREAETPRPPREPWRGREPRCSTCPLRAACPHGEQFCDHSGCTAHPENEAYMLAVFNRRAAKGKRAASAERLGEGSDE